LSDFQKIICVDFDGVLHSYASGWKGADVIPDPPVPGAIEWLKNFLPLPECWGAMAPEPSIKAVIYSSRSKYRKGIKAMKAWLVKHGLEEEYIRYGCLEFPTKKPAAWLTIDDRAICFEGTFPTTEEMANFVPWNKKTASQEPT
jgi:hypothetical protein